MIIGFHSSAHLSERGTCIAMFDYAYYNQKLNGYKSIIFYQINHFLNNSEVIEKFKKEFQVIAYNSFSEIDNYHLDYFYNIKATNENYQITKFKNLSHVVFDIFNEQPRENETIAVISEGVKNNKTYPIVPHMINLPKTQENMRTSLNIPQTAIVFGRYGGYDQFDILFVHEAIKEILDERNDIYFLFANTEQFYTHPRIIYLQCIVDLEKKVKFINTCDAMIHARTDGETFGLSIAEFSVCDKPVITTYGTYNAHIDLLKNNKIIYSSKESLKSIFRSNLNEKDLAYIDFTPEKVMKQFNKVFLGKD